MENSSLSLTQRPLAGALRDLCDLCCPSGKNLKRLCQLGPRSQTREFGVCVKQDVFSQEGAGQRRLRNPQPAPPPQVLRVGASGAILPVTSQ